MTAPLAAGQMCERNRENLLVYGKNGLRPFFGHRLRCRPQKAGLDAHRRGHLSSRALRGKVAHGLLRPVQQLHRKSDSFLGAQKFAHRDGDALRLAHEQLSGWLLQIDEPRSRHRLSHAPGGLPQVIPGP